ncbi:MAG: fasciclin domain-containing protein [Dysgonamonadaceae bacterium]|jgi:uncharacterized surface protein with fasciclin (FAS1) repeats|nr:fasciclin domain-containing protein [Dysgonamonadaceae bacterium]
MKTKAIFIVFTLLLVQGFFLACDEKVQEDAFYTFTGETVASFCENEENNLSIFARLIDESGAHPLLSVYGHFTCFAPTDEAFETYFKDEGISYEDLSNEEKKKIVYDHIIKGITMEYLSDFFEQGALPKSNMNDRELSISFVDEGDKQAILVNNSSKILSKDNEVHNGVVHIVNRVIKPSINDLLSVVKDAGYFRLFSEAFELTHLIDSMMADYDESYTDPSPGNDQVTIVISPELSYTVSVIHAKKLGYTIFAETDEVFATAGIQNLNDLIELAKEYYGTENLDDYTHRNNPLNKFISYHILDRRMATNSIIYSGGNTAQHAMDRRHEYYETFLKMRLIEIKAGNKINTLNDGSYVGVNEELSNLDAKNGYVHALTDVLVYDEYAMINDVLNKRMRIDAYAIPPQLTNNNIRWKNVGESFTISPELCGESFQFNPATKIIFWASNGWDDHQGDEVSIRGWYDFTLRLPPVPPGTYEIRFGYNAVFWRGITQLFIDGEICGIPVDLKITGDDPRVGWIADNQTMDNGEENDKMMRNRGYMKSGNSIINEGWGNILRNSINDLRVIVGTFSFTEYDYHYFRAKNVESENAEFHLDFIEYVPVSHLAVEDKE